MRVLILTRYGRLGASSRLRMLQFLPYFGIRNIEYEVHSLFSDLELIQRYLEGGFRLLALVKAYFSRIYWLLKKDRFDLLWIEKEALPYFPAGLERFLLSGAPYILDYDDATFHVYDRNSSWLIRQGLGLRIDELMAGARCVIAGNSYLAARAFQAGAGWVEIVPTVVDLERYRNPPFTNNSVAPPLTVVWIGTQTTCKYLDIVAEPLRQLRRFYDFNFRVVGVMNSNLMKTGVEYLAWSESTEVEHLSACHIGVMPLIATPWELGKCGYKLIQYMACGLPVVASPVGVNLEIVRSGENGFFAGTQEDWYDHLEMLLTDESLRVRLGEIGRRDVVDYFSLSVAAPKIVDILYKASSR